MMYTSLEMGLVYWGSDFYIVQRSAVLDYKQWDICSDQ